MSSRHGLSIRAADSGDLDGLVELFKTANQAIARDGLVERLAALQREPGAVLIADEWGPPSGLIAIHWRSALTADLKVGEISTLIVDPARCRNGIARLLLKAASQIARSAGCGDLMLTAPLHAEDLRAFCLETGFNPAGAIFTRPLRKRT